MRQWPFLFCLSPTASQGICLGNAHQMQQMLFLVNSTGSNVAQTRIEVGALSQIAAMDLTSDSRNYSIRCYKVPSVLMHEDMKYNSKAYRYGVPRRLVHVVGYD